MLRDTMSNLFLYPNFYFYLVKNEKIKINITMLIVCTQANSLLVAGVCFSKSMFQILPYNVEIIISKYKDVCP